MGSDHDLFIKWTPWPFSRSEHFLTCLKPKVVSAEALKKISDDLRGGSYSDKECAVSMLSGLTLYVDYHDAILRAGVLPSLLTAVEDAKLIPQVRVGLRARLFLMKKSFPLHCAGWNSFKRRRICWAPGCLSTQAFL